MNTTLQTISAKTWASIDKDGFSQPHLRNVETTNLHLPKSDPFYCSHSSNEIRQYSIVFYAGRLPAEVESFKVSIKFYSTYRTQQKADFAKAIVIEEIQLPVRRVDSDQLLLDEVVDQCQQLVITREQLNAETQQAMKWDKKCLFKLSNLETPEHLRQALTDFSSKLSSDIDSDIQIQLTYQDIEASDSVLLELDSGYISDKARELFFNGDITQTKAKKIIAAAKSNKRSIKINLAELAFEIGRPAKNFPCDTAYGFYQKALKVEIAERICRPHFIYISDLVLNYENHRDIDAIRRVKA